MSNGLKQSALSSRLIVRVEDERDPPDYGIDTYRFKIRRAHALFPRSLKFFPFGERERDSENKQKFLVRMLDMKIKQCACDAQK